jgi:hypothetical protein
MLVPIKIIDKRFGVRGQCMFSIPECCTKGNMAIQSRYSKCVGRTWTSQIVHSRPASAFSKLFLSAYLNQSCSVPPNRASSAAVQQRVGGMYKRNEGPSPTLSGKGQCSLFPGVQGHFKYMTTLRAIQVCPTYCDFHVKQRYFLHCTIFTPAPFPSTHQAHTIPKPISTSSWIN